MKIENFTTENTGGRAKVFATVKWEDCDRPDQVISFETDAEFSAALSCNPHAFLVGGIMPALHNGEKRVFVDAAVCPELIDGILTAMAWIRHWWYSPETALPTIETKSAYTPSALPMPKRAGLFFSGGIDSLATLRHNRLHYPMEHPNSIRDGLLVYGLEVSDPTAFELVKNSMAEIARDASVTLIPVYTNLRDLNDDWIFWGHSFQGAVFSAIAHAVSTRCDTVTISSSHCVCSTHPYGTHPLIDPNFSSSDLQIKHFGCRLSRMDKTKLVADWDVALKNLRVCNKFNLYQPNQLNCGQCEKCLLTMTCFLAIGADYRRAGFAHHDVSAEQLKKVIRINTDVEHYYEELIRPLEEKGYHDLAGVIKLKLENYRKSPGGPNYFNRLKRIPMVRMLFTQILK
ncbi:MAG: hypothetical protein WAK95_03090 [Desulfobacterales bacterium]